METHGDKWPTPEQVPQAEREKQGRREIAWSLGTPHSAYRSYPPTEWRYAPRPDGGLCRWDCFEHPDMQHPHGWRVEIAGDGVPVMVSYEELKHRALSGTPTFTQSKGGQ